MINFKQFLIKEEIGLGDLGSKIDQMYNSKSFGNQLDGAYAKVTNHIQDNIPLNDTEVTLPSVEKTGRIVILLLKKNPIYIKLSDGTEAYFTYTEFRKIKGKPEIGKVMTIIFQRHPNDQGRMVSKIDQAFIRD